MEGYPTPPIVPSLEYKDRPDLPVQQVHKDHRDYKVLPDPKGQLVFPVQQAWDFPAQRDHQEHLAFPVLKGQSVLRANLALKGIPVRLGRLVLRDRWARKATPAIKAHRVSPVRPRAV